ncbi:hypothetical protein H2200_000831 [Cladophialophora chaetospira]|uniref:Uncharacterized protein n=1 Tax=Cladophialophora chaetospira TaxID=386627 RepID=A0AA39CQQ4_9EURO|nr:hypothetical protein H2200_000831 [Cladophialophora chaetospira]
MALEIDLDPGRSTTRSGDEVDAYQDDADFDRGPLWHALPDKLQEVPVAVRVGVDSTYTFGGVRSLDETSSPLPSHSPGITVNHPNKPFSEMERKEYYSMNCVFHPDTTRLSTNTGQWETNITKIFSLQGEMKIKYLVESGDFEQKGFFHGRSDPQDYLNQLLASRDAKRLVMVRSHGRFGQVDINTPDTCKSVDMKDGLDKIEKIVWGALIDQLTNEQAIDLSIFFIVPLRKKTTSLPAGTNRSGSTSREKKVAFPVTLRETCDLWRPQNKAQSILKRTMMRQYLYERQLRWMTDGRLE